MRTRLVYSVPAALSLDRALVSEEIVVHGSVCRIEAEIPAAAGVELGVVFGIKGETVIVLAAVCRLLDGVIAAIEESAAAFAVGIDRHLIANELAPVDFQDAAVADVNRVAVDRQCKDAAVVMAAGIVVDDVEFCVILYADQRQNALIFIINRHRVVDPVAIEIQRTGAVFEYHLEILDTVFLQHNTFVFAARVSSPPSRHLAQRVKGVLQARKRPVTDHGDSLPLNTFIRECAAQVHGEAHDHREDRRRDFSETHFKTPFLFFIRITSLLL